MPEIDLGYAKALKLLYPDFESVTINLIGCGGTGSWLAPAVTRIGKLLMERFNKKVELVFYDPDRVEEKNIYRQNFCAAEIGMNKAEALAERYGMAWGINIIAVEHAYSGQWGANVMQIGCVDTQEGRKSIEISMQSGYSWLDCGNTKNYGQVLFGTGDAKVDPFAIKGYCSTLPWPSRQHPELVKSEKQKKEKSVKKELSCAEIALQDSQGLAINQRMAAEAADYLVRIFITRDLKKYATYIDLESGTTRSEYITEEALKKYEQN